MPKTLFSKATQKKLMQSSIIAPWKMTMPSAVVRISFICPVTLVASGELISVHLHLGGSERKAVVRPEYAN